MAKQVSAEFVALFEQHYAQIATGQVMNETFVHFADKLFAMFKDDYKTLYELEKKEHNQLLAETRPKLCWGGEETVLNVLSHVLDADSELHRSHERGEDLYSSNPSYNDCATGTRQKEGIWMNISNNRPDFQEPLHTPPHSPIERVCPGAPSRPTNNAALFHTANSRGQFSLFSPVGASAPLSPIEQIPDDHF